MPADGKAVVVLGLVGVLGGIPKEKTGRCDCKIGSTKAWRAPKGGGVFQPHLGRDIRNVREGSTDAPFRTHVRKREIVELGGADHLAPVDHYRFRGSRGAFPLKGGQESRVQSLSLGPRPPPVDQGLFTLLPVDTGRILVLVQVGPVQSRILGYAVVDRVG